MKRVSFGGLYICRAVSSSPWTSTADPGAATEGGGSTTVGSYVTIQQIHGCQSATIRRKTAFPTPLPAPSLLATGCSGYSDPMRRSDTRRQRTVGRPRWRDLIRPSPFATWSRQHARTRVQRLQRLRCTAKVTRPIRATDDTFRREGQRSRQ